RASIGFSEIAIRLKNRAKRADVAENITGPLAERLPRDANSTVVDLAQIFRVTMTLQHERAAAERVRDKAISAGFDITSLDSENALRMSHVPHFAAIALLETGQHELRPHRAIADETTFEHGFAEWLFHA